MLVDVLGRAAIAGRLVLGAGGGYLAAAITTQILSVGLPLERAEAVIFATMLSFVIMIVAVLFAFAARSLRRVFIVIVAACLLLAGGLWLVAGTLPLGFSA